MCLSPITLKENLAGRVYERRVPCGHCLECLKKRQSSYVVRTIEAVRSYGSMWFVTLTYNDDKCPCTELGHNTLRRKDLQNWKKHFKKFISSQNFAWLLCGEYGPKTHRPHYHGCIIGLSDSDVMIAEKSWSDYYGFTCFKKVPTISCDGSDDVANVARYISKYIVKPDNMRVPFEDCEMPRVMSSIGYGLPKDFKDYKNLRDYMLAFDKFDYDPYDIKTINSQIVDTVIGRLKYQYRGFHYSVPMYIIKKFLYEKDYSGSLRPSALSRLVSATLRIKSEVGTDKAFRKLEADSINGENSEAFAAFQNSQENMLLSRYQSAEKNFKRVYQKSKF